MSKVLRISNVLILIFLLNSCTKDRKLPNNDNHMKIIKTIKQAQWDKLANKKIYFGHQSVGYNMIDGVELILKENPKIGIKIKEGDDIKAFVKTNNKKI